MASLPYLPVLLLVTLLLTLGPLHAAAAALHDRSASAPAHHLHRPPTSTATAPSTLQYPLEQDEARSLPVLDTFTAGAVVAQAPSSLEEAIVATDGDPALLDPLRERSSPSPSFGAAANPASVAPLQTQEAAECFAREVAAPRADEPAASPTAALLPDQCNAWRRVRARAARLVASRSGDERELLQLEHALASLGYNEMASAVAHFADSPTIAWWRGRPITVFAVPDAVIKGSFPGCSRRHLLLNHTALGYFSYSELAASSPVNLPSASVGFCLDVSFWHGPFEDHRNGIYVAGVKVSSPELYNDGRYVVHGLQGFIRTLSNTSCINGLGRRRLTCPRMTAAGPGPYVMRTMILESVACLHIRGFSVIALAMIHRLSDLEKLENMTVFALDDQGILTELSNHGYIPAMQLHIVPGHRLTLSNLTLLEHGTVLPTAAEMNLIMGSIDYSAPDMVISSRLAIHGISSSFAHWDMVEDTESWTALSNGFLYIVSMAVGALCAAVALAIYDAVMDMLTPEEDVFCSRCRHRLTDWIFTCCDKGVCALCLPIAAVNSHTNSKGRTCRKSRNIVPVLEPNEYEILGMPPYLRATLELPEHPWFLIDDRWVRGNLECTFASLDDCLRGGPIISKKKVLYVVKNNRMVRGCEIDTRALLFWVQG